MTKRYFEDFEIGDRATATVGRTVSEHDVYTCAGLTGSYSELHTNREAMADTEYGDVLVQGVLLIVQMDGFGNRMPWDPDVIAFYGMDDVRFVNPVFIGDTLTMEGEVTDKEARSDDRGFITIKEDLVKTDGTLACTRGRHLIIRRA